MREQHYKWYSPYLSRDIEMLEFGHAGLPIILFATTKGRYYQNKDFLMMESVRWFLENGKVRIYCPDSVDESSWYNRSVHPVDRVKTHEAYERMILNEVVKKAQVDGSCHKVAFAGCSFGGFHAVNIGFRHPNLTSHIISMSGAYNMGSFTDGFMNDTIYYNSPFHFIGGVQEGESLWNMRQMNIILGVPEFDQMKEENFQFSGLLNQKGINHWLDFRNGGHHDWPIWRDMFPFYLSKIV